MTILGYGEDALTFHALTKGFTAFLDELGDQTSPEEVTVFFRPSFGRRSAAPEAGSSQFGEFDAIISSDSAIYLVEARWDRSGEIRGDELELRKEQVRRHLAMRAYLEAAFEVHESGAAWSRSALTASVSPKLVVSDIGLAIPRTEHVGTLEAYPR